MKTDFEHWLAAQFADTGSFTAFIVLVRIAGDEVVPVKSSYAHLIGDDMPWPAMRALLDSARAPWEGVAFFVGMGHDGGPLSDAAAAAKLREVEADVKSDPLTFNRGMFFDCEGRHLRVDQVAG
jgi:NADPH-dependent ferric siderophore reductase